MKKIFLAVAGRVDAAARALAAALRSCSPSSVA
jgi:hypothetical protein